MERLHRLRRHRPRCPRLIFRRRPTRPGAPAHGATHRRQGPAAAGPARRGRTGRGTSEPKQHDSIIGGAARVRGWTDGTSPAHSPGVCASGRERTGGKSKRMGGGWVGLGFGGGLSGASRRETRGGAGQAALPAPAAAPRERPPPPTIPPRARSKTRLSCPDRGRRGRGAAAAPGRPEGSVTRNDPRRGPVGAQTPAELPCQEGLPKAQCERQAGAPRHGALWLAAPSWIGS